MGSTPKPQPVVLPPPVVTQDKDEIDAMRRERARTRALFGRRGTMITGASGAAGSPTLGVPSLLGVPRPQ